MAETTRSPKTVVFDSHKLCCFLLQTGSLYLFLFSPLASFWVRSLALWLF